MALLHIPERGSEEDATQHPPHLRMQDSIVPNTAVAELLAFPVINFLTAPRNYLSTATTATGLSKDKFGNTSLPVNLFVCLLVKIVAFA